MNNKKIAIFERDFIGGTPRVERFENENGNRSVDVLSVSDGTLKNRTVYATIGLHKTDLGLSVRGVPLRAELILAAKAENDLNKNMIASAAFSGMESGSLKPGTIIHDIIGEYIKDTEVKHFVCMSPVFWKDYRPLKGEDETVAWLQLVPITEAELAFIEKNGLDAFDRHLEEKKIDVTRFKRKSSV